MSKNIWKNTESQAVVKTSKFSKATQEEHLVK